MLKVLDHVTVLIEEEKKFLAEMRDPKKPVRSARSTSR
jgi:hypothetical protein